MIAAGKAAAQRTVTNDDLSKIVETNDEWISSRTGISRRQITFDESTTDLAYRASVDAINKSGIDKNTIDLIIVATISPDFFMPSTASMLQYRLGLNENNVTAFDLNAACTGLIYAIQVADKFIKSGSVRRALVVGSETLSRTIDWNDRGTCVLFGDGAGALLLERSDSGIMADYTNSRGDAEMNLVLPALPLDSPFSSKLDSPPSKMTMNGGEIFKFATFAIKDTIDNLLRSSRIEIEDISLVIPHQANGRIISKVSKLTKIPLEKFYLNLSKYGNTSSASIGLALAEAMEDGLIKKGDKVLLVGFGGGLTWGGVIHEF
ncbi:ketoacyl-ACP synthase III [Alkalibacter sp. M17DMB]|nr:ketoacyl-ACP synthase III [Alkalibacter mobilis]